MRNQNFNEHGQPFSKKQRKASRKFNAMRTAFIPRNPGQGAMNVEQKNLFEKFIGVMAGVMARKRRKAS